VSPGWADLDRGLFSISVAAELAGLHPQTLRIYEREGLLDPARSAGGTRRYSRRDIEKLAEICALTADGLNLAGIRRVLALQEEARQLHGELARLRELAGGVQRAQERLPDPEDLGGPPGGVGRVVRVVQGIERSGHRRHLQVRKREPGNLPSDLDSFRQCELYKKRIGH